MAIWEIYYFYTGPPAFWTNRAILQWQRIWNRRQMEQTLLLLYKEASWLKKAGINLMRGYLGTALVLMSHVYPGKLDWVN